MKLEIEERRSRPTCPRELANMSHGHMALHKQPPANTTVDRQVDNAAIATLWQYKKAMFNGLGISPAQTIRSNSQFTHNRNQLSQKKHNNQVCFIVNDPGRSKLTKHGH
jgi:hypothetical protein